MRTTRRHILVLAGTAVLPKLAAATLPIGSHRFDVDRLLDDCPTQQRTFQRTYVCHTAVTLLSHPLISKERVGSGYTIIRDDNSAGGNIILVESGAGSWSESARGLNRLGFIREAVLEEAPGRPAECAYLAFMTTSQERNPDQAQEALRRETAATLYSAAQGYSGPGRVRSRIDRLQFSSRLNWRDLSAFVESARREIAANAIPQSEAPFAPVRAAFLYAVRNVLLSPAPRTRGRLFFNSRLFLLETLKEKDAATGARLVAKGMVSEDQRIFRLNATLAEEASGTNTSFRIWYAAGAEQLPPPQFEYQAKPYLSLTFEADSRMPAPVPLTTSAEEKEIG